MTTTNSQTGAPPAGQNQPAVSQAAANTLALQKFFEKDTVKNQLSSAMKENQDSFIASVIDLWTGDKYLQACNPELVAMQALKAAVLKLPVIKSLGYAYIVPYNGTPQLQIGYKGLVQLAIRTNQYRIIHCDVVYEGEYRNSNKLTGEFDLNGQRVNDNVVGYFAHFEMITGFSKTLYMTKQQIVSHAQKFSKSYTRKDSAWNTDFDAMAKKTVLRNLLSHWGFMSVEMQDAMTDEEMDAAEKVRQEVMNKGNKVETGFADAVVVPENNNEPAPY